MSLRSNQNKEIKFSFKNSPVISADSRLSARQSFNTDAQKTLSSHPSSLQHSAAGCPGVPLIAEEIGGTWETRRGKYLTHIGDTAEGETAVNKSYNTELY